MADNIKTLLRLFRLYAKMDFLWLLKDTRYCLLQLFTDVVSGLCSVAGVYLLSVQFGGFGGMSQADVLFMMGFATVADGIYMMFFIGNNSALISRIIGRGQLDHIVIQPVPVWAELLAQGFAPFSSSSLLIAGIVLTGFAMRQAGLAAGPGWYACFLLYAAASALLVVAVMYLLSCLAFYAPAAAEEIASVGKELFTLKTYPLGGMKQGARNTFVTAIPIGLGAWLPSLVLLKAGREGMSVRDIPAALLPPAVTVLSAAAALIFFKKGMKHYAKYGSPRYSGFGHR